MKTTERYLGLILEQSQVTAVEIAHSPRGFTLTAAGSFNASFVFDDQELFNSPGAAKREKEFAKELSSFLKSIGSGSNMLSFGLNSKMAMVETVPMDNSLSEDDIEQHLEWELSHFVANASPVGFSIGSSELDATETESLRVIVAVRKSFVNFLNRVCSIIGGNLNIVDIDHFTAENALKFNYPEIEQQRVILAGVDETTVDVSILINGTAKRVFTMSWNAETDLSKLSSIAQEVNAQTVYFHGRLATPTFAENAQKSITIPSLVIDPFKNVILPQSLKNHEEVAQARHAYASAVGLALRTE
jgi:Tfp pilus assembly PilM family ATPase